MNTPPTAQPAPEADLRTAVNSLLHQIDIGDFVDSHGHSAKMLKPVHDLMRLMAARDGVNLAQRQAGPRSLPGAEAMTAITLPPLPMMDLNALKGQWKYTDDQLRARDLEVARLVLEGAKSACYGSASRENIAKMKVKHHE